MLIYFDLDGPILDVSFKFHKIYTDLLGERGYTTLSKETYWQLKREHVSVSADCPANVSERVCGLLYKKAFRG